MRLAAATFTTMAALILAACGDDTGARDAGADAGIIVSRPDTGPPASDSGVDAGSDAGALPSGVGEACATDADCMGEAGTCLTEDATGLPGGYCSAECVDDADCPHDADCVMLAPGFLMCLAPCDLAAADACTRRGYGCAPGADPGSPGHCLPGCEADDDCASGQRCDRSGGFGGAGACYTEGAALGDPCATDADCAMGGFCRTTKPDGYCVTVGCDYETNTGCPGDGQCLMPSRFAICFDGCTTDTECRPGYACTAPPDTPERLHCAPSG
jgi:hypothetical protein